MSTAMWADPRRADDARERAQHLLGIHDLRHRSAIPDRNLPLWILRERCTAVFRLRDDQRHLSRNSGTALSKRKLKNSQHLRRLPQMSHSTPIGQIQFEEADPHTPVNSQRRLVTPPPVSSKVQRSGLVHIIGKDPPKIPNLFGDFATIVPNDDSQEQ